MLVIPIPSPSTPSHQDDQKLSSTEFPIRMAKKLSAMQQQCCCLPPPSIRMVKNS